MEIGEKTTSTRCMIMESSTVVYKGRVGNPHCRGQARPYEGYATTKKISELKYLPTGQGGIGFDPNRWFVCDQGDVNFMG
mgnify:CR=1 FL=1